jgi:hypothetical protein
MAQVGLNCYAYYNSGTSNSPTWVEMDTIKDLKVGAEIGDADSSSRLDDVATSMDALMKFTVTFNLVKDTADVSFAYLNDAFFERTALDALFLDGSLDDALTTGIRSTWKIFGWDDGQPLENVETIDATLKPFYGSVLEFIAAGASEDSLTDTEDEDTDESEEENN